MYDFCKSSSLLETDSTSSCVARCVRWKTHVAQQEDEGATIIPGLGPCARDDPVRGTCEEHRGEAGETTSRGLREIKELVEPYYGNLAFR
jgi:hypothetical protein